MAEPMTTPRLVTDAEAEDVFSVGTISTDRLLETRKVLIEALERWLGHAPGCDGSGSPCSCGYDEARTLLARLHEGNRG